uniref:Uncharacterized protein n=1 Tax=Mandrillus leucophaeus TaxID=9568 RepID=A0A2K6AAD2_MANLE
MVNKTIGSFPPTPEWWVAFSSWVYVFSFPFGLDFTSPNSSFILGEKTRPYVKTLPMPKCLSPATPNPDSPL